MIKRWKECPGTHPRRSWHLDLQKAQKDRISQAILEVIFVTFLHFWGIIFLCFLGVSLFHILEAFWVANTTPRLPKWSQNWPKSVPRDTLWNVLKPLYLLCCRHMGRSWIGCWNHFFRDRSAKLSPRVFWESRKAFVCDFWWFLGSLGTQFSSKKCFLFCEVRILVHFRFNFGRGRRQGWDSS